MDERGRNYSICFPQLVEATVFAGSVKGQNARGNGLVRSPALCLLKRTKRGDI